MNGSRHPLRSGLAHELTRMLVGACPSRICGKERLVKLSDLETKYSALERQPARPARAGWDALVGVVFDVLFSLAEPQSARGDCQLSTTDPENDRLQLKTQPRIHTNEHPFFGALCAGSP